MDLRAASIHSLSRSNPPPNPAILCKIFLQLTMDLRAASIHSLSFKSAFTPCHFGFSERKMRVNFPVCQLKSAGEEQQQLTPKELHHKRKKEEWKRLRRARRLEKLAEQAKAQEREAQLRATRRRAGLCSFEKYKLAKDSRNQVDEDDPIPEWKSGVKGKTTLTSKFEEEFAIRVKSAVKTVTSNGTEEVLSTNFREDSHDGSEDVSDDWLLAYAHDLNLNSNFEAADSNLERVETDSSTKGRGEVAQLETVEQDELVEKVDTSAFSRSQAHFIDHAFSSRIRVEDKNVGSSDVESSLDVSTLRDWRVNPKTPRRKDKTVGEIIVNRRKGEPLAVIMDENSDSINSETHHVLEALYEDVNSEVKRKSVDEKEQLEWLVQELSQAGKKEKFFLSRIMHGARLKWTEGRLLELVKMLGARSEWRRAMECVHWVHSREHFQHCRSRYVCTTLLAVLGKCMRPVEALNIFNVMREEHSTYPDMAAYHSIAVTLGKAGYLSELLHLIQSLRAGPARKHHVRGTPNQLNWNGRLEPDIVVYNAVINACGPQRQWEGVGWVLQQIQLSEGLTPNSITYGLAIEVMVKSGQFDRAWRYYEIMERGGFLPNALTFKALVEALGMSGEVEKAIEMVQDMERRGVIECAGVYYALASALCTAGRISDALVQVEKLMQLPGKKPDVVTFTGLIRTCDKVGRWQDAIALFNRMQEVSIAPNVGTYNIMIALYGRHRLFEEARNVFESVKRGRHLRSKFNRGQHVLRPRATEQTYEPMLGACAACRDWGYFEVVLDEFQSRGFQLDCRRHAWFFSPLVKSRQERLIHVMANRLHHSTDLYKTLFPLLLTHRQYTQVVNFLDLLLDQKKVALNTPEWSSIVGNALNQLPMIDTEEYLCTKVTTDDDYKLVTELLHCLAFVGNERKARRLVALLGLEVAEFGSDGLTPVGDPRLLPQDHVENSIMQVPEFASSSLCR